MRANGRKPTRSEKDILSKNNLSPKNWRVVKHTSDIMKVVNKKSSSTTEIELR